MHGTITVSAPNVTIRNLCVRPDAATDFGIVIRWVNGTVIDHVQVVGADRVHQGVQAYDASFVTVRYSDIAGTDDGISAGVGMIESNYLHDPRPGGHSDMIEATGWRNEWPQSSTLTIRNNTILNPMSQTSAIALFQDNGVQFRNATVDHNLLAGGAYTLYAGGGNAGPGTNIKITNNVFDRRYFPDCGSAGHVTAYGPSGAGNVWTANTYEDGSPA